MFDIVYAIFDISSWCGALLLRWWEMYREKKSPRKTSDRNKKKNVCTTVQIQTHTYPLSTGARALQQRPVSSGQISLTARVKVYIRAPYTKSLSAVFNYPCVCVCVKVDRPQWHYTSCTIDYHRQQFSDIHDYVYYYVYLVRHMCVCARARERAHEISLKIIIIVLYIKRRILRGIGAWTTIKRDEEYYKNVALVHRWKSSSYVYYDGLFIEVVSFSLRLFRYVMYVFFCTTIHFLILLYSFCLANVRVNEARPIRKY